MPFTKIKISKGDCELAWRDDGIRQNIEHRLTSSESPRPEFEKAARHQLTGKDLLAQRAGNFLMQ